MLNDIIIYSILTVSYFILKSIKDTLTHHFNESVFRTMSIWWNTNNSWKLKYKNGNKNEGERFLGSTTVFVFVTDAWHFINFIQHNIIVFGFMYKIDYPIYIIYPLLYCTGTIIFEILYSKVLIKK